MPPKLTNQMMFLSVVPHSVFCGWFVFEIVVVFLELYFQNVCREVHPPFNNKTATNIGRVFLNLIKKHFSRQHKFYKIFNKYNVKVSYSCMPNVKSKIDAHNKRILTSTNADIDRTYNCSRNTICPLDNNCLAQSIVYEATISSDLQNRRQSSKTTNQKNILVYAKAL